MSGITRRRALSPLVVTVLLAAGCGQEGNGTPSRDSGAEASEGAVVEYEDITVEELQGLMAEGDLFLVNVHIPFEGDIPGTDESIQFDQIADHLERLPEALDARIVLYCRSGRMSAEAAHTLTSLGYTNVSNLQGGFRAWQEAGNEILR